MGKNRNLLKASLNLKTEIITIKVNSTAILNTVSFTDELAELLNKYWKGNDIIGSENTNN